MFWWQGFFMFVLFDFVALLFMVLYVSLIGDDGGGEGGLWEKSGKSTFVVE